MQMGPDRPATRHTLRRNTASIMKIEFDFEKSRFEDKRLTIFSTTFMKIYFILYDKVL